MDNPEKLATLGTQDEDKQITHTTQYVLDMTVLKQARGFTTTYAISAYHH